SHYPPHPALPPFPTRRSSDLLDMARWMLGLGWPRRVSSSGGILVQKGATANIPDTQTCTFDFGDLTMVWQHRTWGDPPDPKYPRSEEHTSELQSQSNLVCRLL